MQKYKIIKISRRRWICRTRKWRTTK